LTAIDFNQKNKGLTSRYASKSKGKEGFTLLPLSGRRPW